MFAPPSQSGKSAKTDDECSLSFSLSSNKGGEGWGEEAQLFPAENLCKSLGAPASNPVRFSWSSRFSVSPGKLKFELQRAGAALVPQSLYA